MAVLDPNHPFSWVTWAQGFFPGALLGALVAYLTGMRLELFRRNVRVRDEHLKQLKDNVLDPIHVLLRDFYIPACELRHGVIERRVQVRTQRPPSVTETDFLRTDFYLQAKNSNPDITIAIQQAVVGRPDVESDTVFYPDAKAHHYSELLGRWETFKASFDDATQQCLAYVQGIRDRLSKEIGLPALPQNYPAPDMWASYELLAMFIYERQLGINWNNASVYPKGNNLMTLRWSGEDLIYATTKDEVDKTLKMVADLIEDASQIEQLKKPFCNLLPEAEALADVFCLEKHKNVLPKECPLV